MNPNFIELLRAFIAAEVRYMVVGAYAVGVHGRPRATGDLDIWVDAKPVSYFWNASRPRFDCRSSLETKVILRPSGAIARRRAGPAVLIHAPAG